MPTPLHVALVAVGSHGDVHPFIGIGLRLLGRGHRVTLLANGHFESLTRRNGLDFLPLGTDTEYRELIADPDLWNSRKAFYVVARGLIDVLDRVYAHLQRLHQQEGDRLVVAGSSLALGARVAQEKLGIPLATVHLAPAVFQSIYDTPKYPGLFVPVIAPKWFRKILYVLINRLIDGVLAKPVNAYRASLGLPATRGMLKQYWHSPQRVLAMFPEWYAAVQPDWPMNAKNIGFPLYDERGLTPISEDLERFLNDGPPPIAFTPGSAMFQGQAFFAASAEACRLLGRRGLLLSRHAGHIPPHLPPGVIHVPYAPFSELLPRCAALVHHGGIGTSAQALAAGTPQLIQPFAHDQPDNAFRLKKIGVARSLAPRKYKPYAVARELATLIGSPDVTRACAQAAARLRGNDAIDQACNAIESLSPTRSLIIAQR